MKIKTPLFIFLLLAITSVLGADSLKIKISDRFYAGFSFTPGVSFHILSENRFGPDSIDADAQRTIFNWRKKNEVAQFGFNAGFKAGYRVTSFMAVESGVEYSMMQYFNRGKYPIFSNSPSGSDGSGVSERYTYHYLNIPIGLHFNIGKKKVTGAISTGIIFNVYMVQTYVASGYINGVKQSTVSGVVSRNLEPFRLLNVSPFLGVGVDYRINALMKLRIMPVAQIQALKNIPTPITEHLWSAGINLSLLFELKRKASAS